MTRDGLTALIRAALEAAAQAMCREAKSCRGDCGDRCAWREPDVSMPACAAAAIAAFLQDLPPAALDTVPGVGYLDAVACRNAWLRAVEQAAKEADHA
jgi:hypothetical protein